MKLLNIGKRTFVTSKGKFAPMDVLEFDDKEGNELLECYQNEFKLLADAIKKEEVTASTDTKKKK